MLLSLVLIEIYFRIKWDINWWIVVENLKMLST